MRKVGHKSAKKEDIQNSEDELDLDQGIEDCLDEKHNDIEKDKVSVKVESEKKTTKK